MIQSDTPGFLVNTQANPGNTEADLVTVTPATGWLRSHGSGTNAWRAPLGTKPVRLTVLVNRTIVFQQPGHYQVTVTTWRLAESSGKGSALRTTNAVDLDIAQRDETRG